MRVVHVNVVRCVCRRSLWETIYGRAGEWGRVVHLGASIYDVRKIVRIFYPLPPPFHWHKSADFVPFVCFWGPLPHPLRTSYMEAPYQSISCAQHCDVQRVLKREKCKPTASHRARVLWNLVLMPPLIVGYFKPTLLTGWTSDKIHGENDKLALAGFNPRYTLGGLPPRSSEVQYSTRA